MKGEVLLNRELALRELGRRVIQERGRYYIPNGKIEKFLKIISKFPVGDKATYICILRTGNSFGKSALATVLSAYLSERFANPWLDDIPYLRRFPRKCRGRILTTANAASINYQEEFDKWFPRGRYTPHKDGHTFNRRFTWRNGSEFDILTFDQKPDQGESVTLNWAVVDEPMSRKHWGALRTRFRFGGIIFLILTPLAGSAWYHDQLETPERLGRDVFVLQGHTEDNCVEHGLRGILPHSYIEELRREFEEDELEARLEGGYQHLIGRVYKNFDRTVHVMDEFPLYHQECWDQDRYTLYHQVDPHDRKPFAIGWYASFPNDDTFTIAEWPEYMFHKVKSCDLDEVDYAKLIKATENDLEHPADVRRMDPNFGNSTKFGLGGKTVKQVLADQGLNYQDTPDDLHEGHQAVRRLLGNPRKKIQPKLYFLSHCVNHIYGMEHYAWKEARDDSKGISELPELVYKDFPDLVRYGALAGLGYRAPLKPLNLWAPKKHWQRHNRRALS